MTMNTKGAVVGGTVGALIGGLAGFFAEHAMSKRRRMAARIASKRQAEYTAGGAVVGGALGAYFGVTQTAAALPSSGSTPSGGGGGGTPNPGSTPSVYWNSLSSAQQQTYKQDLWNWIAAGNWDPSTQPIQGSDATALDDAGNLALATDAFQAVWNSSNPNSQIGQAGAGVVDAPTYQAVTQ